MSHTSGSLWSLDPESSQILQAKHIVVLHCAWGLLCHSRLLRGITRLLLNPWKSLSQKIWMEQDAARVSRSSKVFIDTAFAIHPRWSKAFWPLRALGFHSFQACAFFSWYFLMDVHVCICPIVPQWFDSLHTWIRVLLCMIRMLLTIGIFVGFRYIALVWQAYSHLVFSTFTLKFPLCWCSAACVRCFTWSAGVDGFVLTKHSPSGRREEYLPPGGGVPSPAALWHDSIQLNWSLCAAHCCPPNICFFFDPQRTPRSLAQIQWIADDHQVSHQVSLHVRHIDDSYIWCTGRNTIKQDARQNNTTSQDSTMQCGVLSSVWYYTPGTLNNYLLMDVWWNNHFPSNELESSN